MDNAEDHRAPDVSIALVVGLLDAPAVDRLSHQLGEFLADARRRVVVDLSRVSSVDATALPDLSAALVRSAAVFERIVLVCSAPQVLDAVRRKDGGPITADTLASALAVFDHP